MPSGKQSTIVCETELRRRLGGGALDLRKARSRLSDQPHKGTAYSFLAQPLIT